ncbi:MAG: periplasmic heavy metal sensor [Mesorhizobium sp.]|uniref:periplasmic heavy metal sensor n=1 Tax=Mesorhizobium sp. TaxID=1871066 RepID=UPI00120A29A0|nr:periplasmic heavy metal sensor [Mesorhizobium sp.]TIR26185.1 MAG: periplasmic heavy metal sensor [Mesorhizobium sp.]
MTGRSWTWAAVLVVLALSLALNFFFIGYAAHGLRQAVAARGLLAEVAGAYSPEVRKEFRSVMRDNRARTFEALRQLRAARADLAAAEQARPFDEAAVRQAMAAVRAATTNLQATVQDYLVAAMKNVAAKPAGGG